MPKGWIACRRCFPALSWPERNGDVVVEGYVERGSRHRHALWLVLAALAALALGAAASAAADAQAAREAKVVRQYVIADSADDNGKAPEGVVYDEDTKTYFTGGSEDGAIMRGKLGQRRAQVFLPPGDDGRAGVFGVNVDDEGRLYVATGSQGFLDVIDIETKELIVRFAPGNHGFINDVEIAPNGDVYFTDSAVQNPTAHVIYRVRAEQVDAGTGNVDANVERIPLAPEVTYEPGFNANGIRFTPNGKYILFSDINSNALYRLTPTENPANREIRRVQVTGEFDDPDGLEFLNRDTLYAADNNVDEEIIKLRLSNDYLRAEVLSNTTSDEFHTPTAVALAPKGRLLVANAEFFDPEPQTPFFVTSIKRP